MLVVLILKSPFKIHITFTIHLDCAWTSSIQKWSKAGGGSIRLATLDLLCYADPSLVKKCENAACVLFFYDTTKNHSRRWCSMRVCGNRMKVAAHYQRLRKLK
jgi:predicted RNA-binding Zn ribbon-like protein